MIDKGYFFHENKSCGYSLDASRQQGALLNNIQIKGYFCIILYEPCVRKPVLVRPGLTQTGLHSHIRWLEA